MVKMAAIGSPKARLPTTPGSAIAQRSGRTYSLNAALRIHGFPGILHFCNAALQGNGFSIGEHHAIELQLKPRRLVDNPEAHFSAPPPRNLRRSFREEAAYRRPLSMERSGRPKFWCPSVVA